MCISKEELNATMEEIQSLKKLKEETESTITALERKVIDYLQENADECKETNKKGKELLKFIGNLFTATYQQQERETVNKDEVKALLTDEDYKKVSKVSTYNVLRIK